MPMTLTKDDFVALSNVEQKMFSIFVAELLSTTEKMYNDAEEKFNSELQTSSVELIQMTREFINTGRAADVGALMHFKKVLLLLIDGGGSQ